MPLLNTVETERFELPAPGEWVDLRTRLSAGDRRRLQAASFKAQATLRMAAEKGAGSDLEVPFDLAEVMSAAAFAGVELGVIAWSFDAPVNAENIAKLDEDSFNAIAARLDVLWAPRSEAEKNA